MVAAVDKIINLKLKALMRVSFYRKLPKKCYFSTEFFLSSSFNFYFGLHVQAGSFAWSGQGGAAFESYGPIVLLQTT